MLKGELMTIKKTSLDKEKIRIIENRILDLKIMVEDKSLI